jgi:uncharacterized protein YjbI with pentapeptide repeats
MESDRSRSPFAGALDFSARPAVRALSSAEIERMLAEHRLYLETEWRQGHRANFASADLTGCNFSGMNLRGSKMDRALGGAFLAGASLRSGDLRGAYLRLARLDDADLSDADLGGTEGLTQAQIDQARCNSGTRLPEGLSGGGNAE